jgi:hypothetical protein
MNCLFKHIRHLRPVLVFMALSACIWAQDDSTQGQTPTGAPPAATGGAEEPSLDNPPLSGLDRPRFELPFGGRSYLLPGLQLSESANSNPSGSSASSGVTAVTQGLGSLDLQKYLKRYVVGLDYIGGGSYYKSPFNRADHFTQVHTLSSDQRFLWRTGQFALRDTLDYLPEGSFGFGAVGGAGSFGAALGGGYGAGTGLGGGVAGGTPTGLYGGGSFGALGFQPRIDNTTIADVTQELSARTSVTVGGSFGISHFTEKTENLINSQQSTFQVGYNHLLGRKDQIGVVYAFQEFHFPQEGSGSIEAQVWNVLYAHRITGRLNFVIGGGPQLVEVHNPATTFLLLGIIPITLPASTTKTLTGNGSVTLGYTVSPRTHLQLLFQRLISPGSGFLPGANTDAVRVSASHQFARRWTETTDGGYSYNSGFRNATSTSGLNSQAYQYWYFGASLRRQLSAHFDAFVSYQYTEFGAHSCLSSTNHGNGCGQSINQHTGQIGIDWRPHPIPLD